MHISFVSFLIIALLFSNGKVSAITRYYELNITSVRHNPDCSNHLSSVLMINNQMPGPPLSLNKGDNVQVIVRNNILPNLPVYGGVGMKVSVHFHGIRQINSSSSDGVPFLTQRPIEPGESFTYLFNVPNQVGTFFYHAHVGLEEMSVFGPLIVYDSDQSNPAVVKNQLKDGPFTYDDERTISLSEWWHTDRGKFEAYYLGPNFTQIFEAQTFLMNGLGIFDSSIDLDTNCKGYAIIPVHANRTYRIRVIGAMTFRTLGFAIAGHQMTVIEVDGDYVKPYDVDYLEVSAGQRFSVLITTNQTSDDYGIHVVRKWAAGIPTETNGYATLRYQEEEFVPWSFDEVTDKPVGSRTLSTAALQPSFPVNDTVHWLWDKIEPYYGVEPQALLNSSRVIKLRGSQNIIDGLTRWYINDVSFMEDFNKVILYDVVNTTRNLPQVMDRHVTGYDPHLHTYPLSHLEIVDIVIQTTHREGEPCRSHPWHTHGHSHWEIAYGHGEYMEERDGMIRNVPNPVFKDLTLVYPGESEKQDGNPEIGCGWSKVRIVADNPGIWAMHCHNSPHMYMGMMLAFEESPELITERLFI
ncbi:Cupredoxin [Mucor mucedo]|uniref:Cupredoxin n=1 Tax=Mucor mucedo TaxID=29922 RepID=UPI00221E7BDA|nr:Cupredoxin [Mucor mucedo]KAI7875256.1 Cupredoxin [Mucor mucedo]